MMLKRSGMVLGLGVVLGVACGRGQQAASAPTSVLQAGGAGKSGAGAVAPDGGTASPLPFVSPGASFAPGTLCEPTGWCWYDPIPSGTWWRGIAGVGRDEAWIGGTSPNVLRFVGGRWTVVVSPLSDTEAIWASAPNDVWFGGISTPGTGAIAHWDGQAISVTLTVNAGEIDALWASGPHDVYAAGFGVVEHWDGATWTLVPGVTGSSVSGSGPNDVWIGASDGLWHFDGNAWARLPTFEGFFIDSVAVRGRDDVWVLGAHAGLQDVDHFDGTTWSTTLEIPTTGPGIILQSLGIGIARDVWLVGTAFRPTEERGYLARFDGSSWTVGPDAPTPLFRVRALPGIGEIAVGQNGGILLLSSTTPPTFTDLRSGPEEDLLGVWGSSPTDMWAVGRAGTVLHYDGHQVATIPSGVTVDLTDVWGTAPDDVWIVGQGGTALHFDGTSLQPVATGTTVDLFAVFTLAAGDVWMGGSSATLTHLRNGAIEPATLTGLTGAATVLDLHGLAPDDIWLSGGPSQDGTTPAEPGFVAHFDGTAWAPVVPVSANNGGFPVHRIWELAPNDVWALTQPLFRDLVGYFHFDGTTWTAMPMPDSPQTFMFPKPAEAFGSFVFGPHDRWIVGALGTWQRSTQ